MLTGPPSGERAVLELIALRLLCTVTQPHEYTETTVNAGIACYNEFDPERTRKKRVAQRLIPKLQ